MYSDKQKKISIIIQQFNRHLSKILKISQEVDKDNIDLEWIRRVVRILRDENPPLVLERCINKLWDNSEQIIARDKNFFIDNINDLNKKYIKNDERKEWIEGIVDYLRKKADILTKDQTEDVWDCLNGMLENVIKYRILIGDFDSK